MYADDNILHTPGAQFLDVQSNLQDVTDKSNDWYCKNKLSINVPKSSVMAISSTHKKMTDSLKIKINDFTLEQVTHMKYLGIQIDEHLQWDEQLMFLAKTVSHKLHCLRKLKSSFPIHLLCQIYQSCIQPHLDYCCTVWGFLPETKLQKVQHIQNSAARIICNNFDFINFRGIDFVKDLKWQSFTERRDFLAASLMFKCIHEQAPHYLSDQVVMMCDIQPYGTRSTYNMDVYVPPARTEQFKRSFQYAGAVIWNGLTDTIKDSPTYDKFKLNYKKEYFH